MLKPAIMHGIVGSMIRRTKYNGRRSGSQTCRAGKGSHQYFTLRHLTYSIWASFSGPSRDSRSYAGRLSQHGSFFSGWICLKEQSLIGGGKNLKQAGQKAGTLGPGSLRTVLACPLQDHIEALSLRSEIIHPRKNLMPLDFLFGTEHVKKNEKKNPKTFLCRMEWVSLVWRSDRASRIIVFLFSVHFRQH